MNFIVDHLFLSEAISRSHYSLFCVVPAAALPPPEPHKKSSDMPFDRGYFVIPEASLYSKRHRWMLKINSERQANKIFKLTFFELKHLK
ncbi:hypothetical protein [Chryseobacterium hispalense]|uniref:hypothetical protein n=1 Tax=Chryseobacterium hispalense TaxID=1453492 RepID=UPI0004933847|nr:hypothetical protein [Chryseobacterium hispalense]